jgi:hypothetical protein
LHFAKSIRRERFQIRFRVATVKILEVIINFLKKQSVIIAFSDRLQYRSSVGIPEKSYHFVMSTWISVGGEDWLRSMKFVVYGVLLLFYVVR